MLIYKTTIFILWVLIAIYWIILSFKNKEPHKRESLLSRSIFLVIMVISFYLLFSKRVPFIVLNGSFYNHHFFYYTGFIIAVAGLIFASYSRYILGNNWSGRIEIKKDHKLITNGPYSITRNPIYTGLLSGVLGTALMYNQLKGILALILLFCAYSMKIIKEEKFLLKNFPEYKNYMRKVKRLIPFLY